LKILARDYSKSCARAIALQNGLLDLETKTLGSFDPNEFVTQALNITYDPEAANPETLKFIKEIVGEEYVPTIQEMFGYCLYHTQT